MNPHYQQTRKSRQNCRHSSISNSFSTSRTNAPRSLSRVKAGTHATSAPNRTHSGLRGETRGVSDGGVSLPSLQAARSRISPSRVSERHTLPLLGLGWGRSQRTQKACGTAMRLCASLFRGVAAPLGCAYICRKYINFPSRILLPKSKDRQEKPLSDVPHPCF